MSKKLEKEMVVQKKCIIKLTASLTSITSSFLVFISQIDGVISHFFQNSEKILCIFLKLEKNLADVSGNFKYKFRKKIFERKSDKFSR
jgi:nicotinamide riboside transporter PnuC